ncbi:MAG: hypothetical protein K0R73_429 [Candidatus Midichloriaceae bacterium]|jgi:hypothetical protein|nr:hypothetical protein [Candidatus Midichloriaceae bacterium]
MHPGEIVTDWIEALIKANKAPRCLAKTRLARLCQSPAMKNGRCRMHGGKSPGAPCGKKHGRYKSGLYTKQQKLKHYETNQLIKATKLLFCKVNEAI